VTRLAAKASIPLALLVTVAASGSACAMNSTPSQSFRCVVEGAERLPPGLGGGDAVCSAVAKAATPVLERNGVDAGAVSVVITVQSASAISAATSVAGKSLPEQKVAISDRSLNPRAIDMLANAVAAELAKLP
jgi:hypothetical protein